jgi:hypothetical protein
MKSLDQLPTIANVGAGNTVTVNLPVGNVYERIFLYYTGVTAEQLKNIKLELNTRLVSEWPDGARLLSIDAHYDREAISGVLIFNFTRPELHELKQRRFFGLDTSASQGITLAAIQITIDAGAAAPVLKAYAEKSTAVQGVPNYLTKIRRFIVPVSQIGQFDIDNIPRPKGASIAAIHLYMPDGADGDALCDITKATLLVNNVNWHDIDAVTAADIQTIYKRTPQTADSTVIDLILDGDIMQALPLDEKIQDFRLRCTSSDVGQVEVMVEYIDLWGVGRF